MITAHQARVMDAIASYIRENHQAPTYRELSSVIGVCLSGVHARVSVLVALGYLRRATPSNRVLEIIKMPGEHEALRDSAGDMLRLLRDISQAMQGRFHYEDCPACNHQTVNEEHELCLPHQAQVMVDRLTPKGDHQ